MLGKAVSRNDPANIIGSWPVEPMLASNAAGDAGARGNYHGKRAGLYSGAGQAGSNAVRGAHEIAG